jgi:hypothetical protein
LFSPHANLHLKAAALAINHTELFFENIRQEIGDKEFANFLQLEVGKNAFCAASTIEINSMAIILLCIYFIIQIIF